MQEPNSFEVYRHFKGDEYEVICVGDDASIVDRRMVVYRSMRTKKIWVRPLSEWHSLVKLTPDSPEQPRFQRI